MKVCPRCQKEAAIKGYCSRCRKEARQESRERIKLGRKSPQKLRMEAWQNLLQAGKKFCRACEQTKVVEEFHKNAASPTGYAYECKKCSSARKAKEWKENPEPARRRNRKSLYGIEEEQFKILNTLQEGRCAVCAGPPTGNHKTLSVDHSHANGKIRGLLCAQCNAGLGNFKDSPELLREALEYLKRFLD